MLAPMVRASTLAFRLLCRRYGARTAFTPAIVSLKLADPAALTVRRQPVPAYGASAELVELYCAKDATPVLATLQGTTRCPLCERERAQKESDDDRGGEPPAQEALDELDDDFDLDAAFDEDDGGDED